MRHVWTLISILLFASAVFLAQDAAAQYDTPKAQLAAGIKPHDIGCNDGKVLAMRSAEISVCVSHAAAERMMWVVVATEFPKYTDAVIDSKGESKSEDDSLGAMFNVTQIKSEPPLPRTGTIHFKDLPRINHTGDIYRMAYNEADANMYARKIAQVIGMNIDSAVNIIGQREEAMFIDDGSYVYTLANRDGSKAGQIKIGKIFDDDSMTSGRLTSLQNLFVAIYDAGKKTHQERVEYAVDIYNRMGYESAKHPAPKLAYHKAILSETSTIIDDGLIVYHPSTTQLNFDTNYYTYSAFNGNGAGVHFKYYTPSGVNSILHVSFNSIQVDETRKMTNQQFPITRDDAKRIMYDFASTSPILNDPQHGCKIKLNNYDDISVDRVGLSLGVPLYIIEGIELGTCEYKYSDYSRGLYRAPRITIDAWTGQFVSIGSAFGHCLGYDESECAITVLHNYPHPIREKFKVGDCWCPGPSEDYLKKDLCGFTPAHRYDGSKCKG